MQSWLISLSDSHACTQSKTGQWLYEERNRKLVSSCKLISSVSIWFINLNLLQCAKSAAWHGADAGCAPRLPSLNSFPLLASILCQRLKIASGLLQNKQFIDSGFDTAFAWRGQLSPACRQSRPRHWFSIDTGLWTLAVRQNGCVCASTLYCKTTSGVYNFVYVEDKQSHWAKCACGWRCWF